MILTIKSVSEELKADSTPKHIEWTAVGADGKEIKVKLYPTLQIEEKWMHFEERWDEFKNATDKTYEIDRANIKLENNRVWKPVIKATEVKDVFRQKALAGVQATSIDETRLSIEGQVALKEVGELLRTNTEVAASFCEAHKKLIELYFIKLYDLMNKFVYGVKVETSKETIEQAGQPSPEPIDDKGGGETPEWADWLKEAIEKLDKPRLFWANHLKETFNLNESDVKNKGLIAIVNTLTIGQRQLFFNEIKNELGGLK